LTSILSQRYEPLDVVVVDNASTDDTPRLFEGKFNCANIQYIRLQSNLGVCGGRNVALEHAKGDILITIDDDAVLRDVDATQKIIHRFAEDSLLGALAFRIMDYWSNTLQKDAFPTKDKARDSTVEFETTWFIGAGHAIPREVYNRVGVYREYFPYGHEELDLALRILDAGYKIFYFPQVTVFHKKITTRHSLADTHFQAIQLQNRIKVAVRNLPWRYVLTTDLVRSAQVLRWTRGNVIPILLAHWYLMRQLPRLLQERKPLRQDTIRRVIAMGGPVLY
jgi:GT2 family glycosyltransferase